MSEIKEILAYFEKYVKITDMHDSEPMLNWKELKILLDYITNLQEEKENQAHTIKTLLEENKELKEIVENLTTMTVCGDKKQIKNTAQYKLEIAQDRINKAIEYINKLTTRMNVLNYQISDLTKKNLLNILQGEDKDE